MHVVLSSTIEQSLKWPYMLDYIAVDIPPLQDNTDWEVGELAAWLLMNATTSGLIQVRYMRCHTKRALRWSRLRSPISSFLHCYSRLVSSAVLSSPYLVP